MFRFEKASRAAMAGVFAIGLLVGCSEADPKAVPRLPERVCWGAFSSTEVAEFLPTGDKVTIRARPFVLADNMDEVTCNVDVDGIERFTAHAAYQDFEDLIEWGSWAGPDSRPIGVGKKGIVWPGGAGTYFVCEPSGSPSEPGKYIKLYIDTSKPPGKGEVQNTLPGLLQEFLTFAERELKCPGAAAKK
ncbi:hypothetical protein [Streptomyces laurentii]|uniref:hypothetical protein n=1 Tax=Streptomyces laurentii TaxID=39478 RepID=UPI00367E3508